MIRVNLLFGQVSAPTEEVQVASPALEGLSADDIQRQGAIRFLILLLIPAGFYVYEMQNIPTKRREIAKLNEEIFQLQEFNKKFDSSVREIKKLKEDEEKVNKRSSAVDSLLRERLNELNVLELIQRTIPEKVWLTYLDFNNSRIQLRGQSLTDSDIANFTEELSKSCHLSSVLPGGSNEVLREGQRVRDFQLSAAMGKCE